ncbi:MAG: tRNA (adenosine(37)-N6)-threonylcarbamoyltransferase complex dimerization subunit type 1 TsaB [Defluviitaleaceae bacterium]|nr:tRNA (adenosine(37)-N6)-threonylcarbamoyltransferase complex dimerization subunit type 1 TsaB [Defluviitaleaceae bacterium]
MKILAVDTSGRSAGVAVVENGNALCVRVVNANDAADGAALPANWKHSQRLLPAVQQMLTEAALGVGDLGAVAYTNGPGSFTGLRIGAATALGLARAAGLPVVAVPTLDAMAYTGIITNGAPRVVTMLDARRGQVYAAVYESDANGLPARVTDYLADAETAVLDIAGEALVIRDEIDPAAVGLWAAANFHLAREAANAAALLYVRAPQAVRERNA